MLVMYSNSETDSFSCWQVFAHVGVQKYSQTVIGTSTMRCHFCCPVVVESEAISESVVVMESEVSEKFNFF